MPSASVGEQPTVEMPRVPVAAPPAETAQPVDAQPDAQTDDGQAGIAPAEGAQADDGQADERPERAFPPLMEQIGGVPGIIASTIPVFVFVVANVVFDLRPALIAAIAAGVAVAVWRLVRHEAMQPAVSGLFGVGLCAFIAYRTGEARGFYLPGLIYSAVVGTAFLVSTLVRWPLAGVIWHAVNGDGQGWRQDRRLLRAYTLASLLWTLVFAARVVVQGLLYSAQETYWLGIARLAMGYPLVGIALFGTVWAVRRAQRVPQPTSA